MGIEDSIELQPPPPEPGTSVATVGPDDDLVVETAPREPTPLKAVWVVAALVAGVATDLALRRPPWNNVAFAILIAVLAVGLLASGFIRTRASQVMLAASIVFGLLLAVRTELLLTLFNFSAAMALLIGAAVAGSGRDLFNFGPARMAADAFTVLEKAVVTPVAMGQEAYARFNRWEAHGSSTSRSVVRGLAIAAPIVVILGLLLASADVVFQSFFTGVDLGVGPLIGHLALIAIGIWGFVALLSMAAKHDDPSDVKPTTRSLGAVETAIILGSITALFTMFAIAQLMTVMGGADEALTRAGLEPKQFARQGFFQLIWVALIAVVVVMTVRVLTSGDERAGLFARIGGYATAVLTMLIVVVALARILFYIDFDGMTPKRLYAFVVCLWIGAALLLLTLRLSNWRPDKSWLTAAMAATAVVTLLAVNAVNPQRLVANNHLERRSPNLIYHVEMNQFQGEGLAMLINGLDRFDADVAEETSNYICDRHQHDGRRNSAAPRDLLEFNWGRNQAEAAVEDLC